MTGPRLRFLIGFVAIAIVVFAVSQFPQYRRPIVLIAAVVVVVAIGVVIWALTTGRK